MIFLVVKAQRLRICRFADGILDIVFEIDEACFGVLNFRLEF